MRAQYSSIPSSSFSYSSSSSSSSASYGFQYPNIMVCRLAPAFHHSGRWGLTFCDFNFVFNLLMDDLVLVCTVSVKYLYLWPDSSFTISTCARGLLHWCLSWSLHVHRTHRIITITSCFSIDTFSDDQQFQRIFCFNLTLIPSAYGKVYRNSPFCCNFLLLACVTNPKYSIPSILLLKIWIFMMSYLWRIWKFKMKIDSF